jgi:hypothetical protein
MTKKNCRRFLLASIMLLSTGFLAASDSGPGVAKCASGAANVRCSSLPVYTYYTDASKTVACGYFEVCSGVQEGCQTEYKTSIRQPCNCGSALSASSEK